MTLFNISGDSSVTSSVPATLATPIHLVGDSAITSNVTATLKTPLHLVGDSAVTSDLTPTLATPIHVVGDAGLTSSLAATLQLPFPLSGDSGVTSSLTATLTVPFHIAGGAGITSSASGTVLVIHPVPVSGDSAITSSLTGTLKPPIPISGDNAVTSALSGTLATPIHITGGGAITSNLTSTLKTPIGVSGEGAITSNLTSTLKTPIGVSGEGAITSNLTSTLKTPIGVSGGGAITSDLSAVLAVPIHITGGGAITSNLTGTLKTPIGVSGGGAITSNLTATLDLPNPLTSPQVTGTTGGFADLQRGTLTSQTSGLSVTVVGTELLTNDLDLFIGDPNSFAQSIDLTIQGTETQTAGLSVEVQGTEETAAQFDILIQGTYEVSTNTSLTIQGTQTVDSATNITVQGTETIQAGLAVLASTGIQAETDILVQGTRTTDASTNVTVQGTEQRDVLTDVNVTLGLPYRLMKVYGHHTSRVLGGNASDANFPEQFLATPGGAVVTTGNGNYGVTAQGLRYVGLSTIPTAGTYDKYSLPLGASDSLTTGFRMLAYFTVDTLGANGSVVLGMFADQQSPLVDFGTSDVLAFGLEVENGQTIPRLWYGGAGGFVSSSVNQGIGNAVNYVGRRLIVEIEVVGAGAVEARLFDQDIDLDHPLTTLALTGGVVTAVDRFSLTTVGRRNAATPPNDQIVILRHVDVEPSGSLYDASAGVTLGAAKWRPYRDRVPVELLQAGTNTITTLLSDDGITATNPGSDSIVLDETEPQLSLVAFLPDSSVILPGSTNPQIVKGSLQPGFDTVQIKWTSNQTGQWSLRLNSTSVLDGIEIQSGAYGVAGAEHVVQFSFSEFPLGDGIYEVTLYLVSDSGRPTARRVGDFLLP